MNNETRYSVFRSRWTDWATGVERTTYIVEHDGERFADDFDSSEMAEKAILIHRLTGLAPSANSLVEK